MKRELKTLWIVVAVLAVLQIVGGSIYTAITAVRERNYTYVDCTVVSVKTTPDGENFRVEGITVSYADSTGNTVTADMVDFPSSFSVGSTFRGRYEQDPKAVSAEHTDWFTPVFLIVLGAVYALADIGALLLRKKMGLYALNEITDEEEPQTEELPKE